MGCVLSGVEFSPNIVQRKIKSVERDGRQKTAPAHHVGCWLSMSRADTQSPWLEEQRAEASQGAAATPQHAKGTITPTYTHRSTSVAANPAARS